MKRLFVIAAVVLLLAGCSSSSPESAPKQATYSYSGHVSTTALDSEEDFGGSCLSIGGYDDIETGAQVIVTDADGKTVAVTTLSDGVLVAGVEPYQRELSTCQFAFAVKVEGKSDFYGIHVGDEVRGTVQYTRTQMTAGPELTLSIFDN
jgi:hypothetical protein